MSTAGKVRAGTDPARFEAAYRDERDRLLRLAVLVVGSRAEAEDVVAEAVTRAWVRSTHLELDNVAAYLQRAVLNRARDWCRARANDRARHEAAAGESYRRAVTGGRSHHDDALLDALGGLGYEQREVLVLRYFGGLTEAECADRLEVSLGTVKSRAARGISKLRAALANEELER